MYLRFEWLTLPRRDVLPHVILDGQQEGAIWICTNELGDLIFANAQTDQYWDARRREWRDCGIHTVLIRGKSAMNLRPRAHRFGDEMDQGLLDLTIQAAVDLHASYPVTIPTEAMTSEQLDQMQARAEAAPAGPWRACCASNVHTCGMVWGHDEEEPVCTVGGVETSNDPVRRATQEFIAHARADVPALVAEVRRLRGQLERTRQDMDAIVQQMIERFPQK